MKSERERLRTFDNNWDRKKPTPLELARAGFFYTGVQDKTQCAFCDGILENWKEDDILFEQHARIFPFCPLVLSKEAGNVFTKYTYKWHSF